MKNNKFNLMNNKFNLVKKNKIFIMKKNKISLAQYIISKKIEKFKTPQIKINQKK